MLKEHSDGKIAFMPCHQYKYSPLWQQFRSYFRHLSRGTKVFAQFHVYRNSADPGISGGRQVWRMNPSIGGGGILADTGVHYLYLIPWIFQRPSRITARLNRLTDHKEDVEDTANVLFEFDRGIAELVLTWGSASRANHASIICPEGSLEYDGSTLVQYDSGTSHTYSVPDASDKSHYTQLYVDLLSHFLDRINMKSVSFMDINEAYESVSLLNACYESAGGSHTIDYGLNP
jgi:predicted dehydrogenase